VDWVCDKGYGNVIIEIANEVMEGHYHHAILKPGRVSELIRRAMLVSTSEAALLSDRQWAEAQIDEVFSATDLVIIHGGDNVETGRVGDAAELVRKVEYIQGRPWFKERPRPILTNESQGEQAFEAVVRRGISYGLHSVLFQTVFPPRWGVWDNETTWFFKRVMESTAR
jgi:hypothetical protein